MRIAFITLGFNPLRMSGFDTSGERLVQALLQAGHQVTVIAAKRDPLEEVLVQPELAIRRLPLGPSNWIGFAYRAAQLVYTLNAIKHFDVIHFWDIHFAFAYRGAFVTSLHQSFRQRSSIVDRNQAGLPTRPHYLIYYSLARQLTENPTLKHATGLLAVSSATRDEFINHYHVSPDRISLVRHGIDTGFYQPTPSNLRQQLGIDPHEPVILFAGFITPRKGLDYLARALPMIRPAPRLILVGRWSNAYRAHFLGLLGPLTSRVIEAGFVPDEQMPAYYSMADVYVSTSLLEGFGLTLAESLACETPAVAADGGATAEVVGPGGIIIPPRDLTAVTDAVSALLQDPLLRDRLGKDGREHIKREFSVGAMLEQTLAAYRRFLDL